MNIDAYKDQIKRASILYVDVYPYILQKKGNVKFLLLKRTDHGELANSWQPVSGKIAKKETIRAAFKRMVLTKTGQKPIKMYKLDIVNMFYDDYYDTVMFVPCAACQLQSESVILSPKLHVDYRWVDEKEAANILEWEMQIHCIKTIATKLATGGFKQFHAIKLNE